MQTTIAAVYSGDNLVPGCKDPLLLLCPIGTEPKMKIMTLQRRHRKFGQTLSLSLKLCWAWDALYLEGGKEIVHANNNGEKQGDRWYFESL